jgi:hypothetical protein
MIERKAAFTARRRAAPRCQPDAGPPIYRNPLREAADISRSQRANHQKLVTSVGCELREEVTAAEKSSAGGFRPPGPCALREE